MKLYKYSWIASITAFIGIISWLHYTSGRIPLTANERAIVAAESRGSAVPAFDPATLAESMARRQEEAIAAALRDTRVPQPSTLSSAVVSIIPEAHATEYAPSTTAPRVVATPVTPAGLVTARPPDCVDCDVPVVQQSTAPAVIRTFDVPAGYEVVSVPTPARYQIVEFPQPDHFEITSPDMQRYEAETDQQKYIARLETQLLVMGRKLGELKPVILAPAPRRGERLVNYLQQITAEAMQ